MDAVDCVVVGAGPAGLAASRALSERGIDHVVLERGRVGETWRSHRWDSFRLNTPGVMNGLLGTLPDDEYSPRDDVVRRLDALAASCLVRVRVTVTAAAAEDGGLTLTTDAGPIRARAVVVATGAENVPRVPTWAEHLDPRLLQLTTASYRSPGELPDGAVLVVGSGQSGTQIVEDLLAGGRRVLLSTSPVGRLPTPYRGRPTILWLLAAGFFDQRPADLPDPAMMRMPNPLIPPGGDHDLDLRRLARRGVGLLGRVTAADGERVRVDDSVHRNVAAGEAGAARARDLADHVIDRLGLAVPAPEPDDDLPYPVLEVDELDLHAEGVTGVVWCAGMRGSHAWLPRGVTDDAGVPRHVDGAAELPGLWFVGLRWMTRRGSSNLYGMPDDAARVADGVAARLDGGVGSTPRGSLP